VADSANPADKSRKISDPEAATLVDRLLASTQSPVGSSDVFTSARQSPPPAPRRTAATSTSNESSESKVTPLGVVMLLVGISAVTLAGVIFVLEL